MKHLNCILELKVILEHSSLIGCWAHDNRAYSGRQECSCTLSCHVSIELNIIDITSKASLTKCASNNIYGEYKDSKSPKTLLGT